MKKIMALALISIALLGMLTLTGCGGDADHGEEEEEHLSGEERCVTDNDCHAGTCVDGICSEHD